MTYLWFAAWRCECTDVKADPADLPDRCPHHDTELLGNLEQVTPGVSTNLGHLCPTPQEIR